MPPGLHIRLNMDPSNGQPLKEAKLIDPNDDNQDTAPHELQIVDSPSVDTDADPPSAALVVAEKIADWTDRKPLGNKKDEAANIKLVLDAVAALQLTTEEGKLLEELNNLTVLSHDIEYGEMFALKPEFFKALLQVAQMQSDAITERVYRIIGASLRNNPEATAEAVRNFDSSFFKAIFSQIKTSLHSDVIQRRVLGAIQTLVQNDHFVYNYFSQDSALHAFGIDSLVLAYNTLGPQSRPRMLEILEDLKFVPLEPRARHKADADNKMLVFVQSWLANNPTMPVARINVYLDSLISLHESESGLHPHQEFLQWISQSALEGHERKKRDDVSLEQSSLDSKILEVRHRLFGNPMADRKSFGDEL